MLGKLPGREQTSALFRILIPRALLTFLFFFSTAFIHAQQSVNTAPSEAVGAVTAPHTRQTSPIISTDDDAEGGNPSVLPRVSSSVDAGAPRRIQQPGAARTTDSVPAKLSLEQAIQISLENNLETLLAKEREAEARGIKLQSLSGLLPNVSGSAYQANRTVNLRALGIQLPGAPAFVGPFDSFDARVRLFQNILDLSAIRHYQSGRTGVEIARFQESVAEEQVATATTVDYIEALRAAQAVEAAQANLELAEALLKLAKDQRNAGVATGVDVARAATRVAQIEVRLSRAQTESEEARLRLQRLIGLPQGSPLTLTDVLRVTPEDSPSIETAIAAATQDRYEIKVAESIIKQREYDKRAAQAEQLPSLALAADYGVSGARPNAFDLPTRNIAIQLNVPILNGGITRGRIAVAASEEKQARLRLGDVRGQVEEDVRLTLIELRTTADQVRAAQQTLELAQTELRLSRDRFAAGVADNVEVVDAQTSIEVARDALIAALAAYTGARANLAAALGRAKTFRL
jgi:outer membrane protein